MPKIDELTDEIHRRIESWRANAGVYICPKHNRVDDDFICVQTKLNVLLECVAELLESKNAQEASEANSSGSAVGS